MLGDRWLTGRLEQLPIFANYKMRATYENAVRRRSKVILS
jgi:hypothetical protein